MCELDHHPNYRKKPSGGKELAGVIGRWSIMGYDPLRCKFVRSLLYICFLWRIVWVSQYLLILQFLMPWRHANNFMLYVLNFDEKSFALIHFKPLHPCFRDIPYKKYARVQLEFYSKFGVAMKVQ